MHMQFWWGYDFGDLIFQGLKVETVGSLILACFVFAMLAIIFEGLKVLETKSRRDHNSRMRLAMLGPCSEDRSNLLGNTSIAASPNCDDQVIRGPPNIFKTKCAILCQQVLLYTSNTSLNYFIMLAVMLYNAYLAAALMIGSTIGYYIFGHLAIRYKIQTVKEKSKVATVCVPECETTGEGSTPPLMKGKGASENNLYTCETQNKCSSNKLQRSQKPDDTEGSVLLPALERVSCEVNPATVKKTLDPNKIKSSKNSTVPENAASKKAGCCSSMTPESKENSDTASPCCKKDTDITVDDSSSEKKEVSNGEDVTVTHDKNKSVLGNLEML